jgi:hypothetical protein
MGCAGIFFLGYFLFEVPSNLLLERIGARKTLRTGSTTYALYLVMVLYVLSGLLVLITVHAARSRAANRDLNTSRSVSA